MKDLSPENTRVERRRLVRSAVIAGRVIQAILLGSVLFFVTNRLVAVAYAAVFRYQGF